MSNSHEFLGDISEAIPDAILDIRYATANNITGRQLYREPRALLLPEALGSLVLAANDLRQQGLRLVIFDAYRPQLVQNRLLEVCSDSNYVHAVSGHSRGSKVDASLAAQDGKPIYMGTDYDDFSEKAHAGTTNISPDQREKRLLLAAVMQDHGFTQYKFEWWDFEFEAARNSPVIEIPSFSQV